MATLLLTVIYIAFIGLGIPDSLCGTAWPAIYTEFRLPISYASFVSVTVCCGTIISSMVSARVIRRFGTNRVSAFSTALTAAALMGFSFSGNQLMMCLCAIPLGLGAGAIDTALMFLDFNYLIPQTLGRKRPSPLWGHRWRHPIWFSPFTCWDSIW